MIKHYLILLLTIATITGLKSQSDSDLGINLGLITYQGDLSQAPINAGQLNFCTGVHYRNFLSPKVALKAGLNIGKISGSDLDYNISRGITMENNLVEVALQAEWHPFGLNSFEESGQFVRNFSPFVGLGLGMVFTNETVSYTGNREFKTEEDTGSLIVVPIDLGIRFAISPSFSATLHGGTRATFSDLLDGVSENGNADANDWYLMGGLGLMYTW
jgi:hypothetical protein